MPKDQMGALTEESSTDEIKDSSTSEAAGCAPEVASFTTELEEEEEEQKTPCRSPNDESHSETQSHETELRRPRASRQRHVIKNMDEIFQTVDEMMKKLHQLRVN